MPLPSPSPPEELLCPITKALIRDPVIASNGVSYDKDAIEMWLALGNSEFPAGGGVVADRQLRPNSALAAKVAQFKQQGAVRDAVTVAH